MIRQIGYWSQLAAIFLIVDGAVCRAAEAAAKPQAERPYLTLFAASLDRLHSACEIIFDSVERPDLAKSIDERSKIYRDFAGIERTKPLGMMFTWGHAAAADIIFVPVQDVQELLKTATFGVLGFHQVNPEHYEIERPGSPYHVFLRNDYGFFADSLSTIRAIRVTPDQLTRGLRDRYDLVFNLDLLQVPQPRKATFVEDLRSQIEPWLQRQDDEASESANLRKTLGLLALDLVDGVVRDTKRLTVGIRLDPTTRQLSLEVIVEAVSKSKMATFLNRMSSHRSEFAPLIQPDVPAGVAFNLPISGLVEQILGTSGDSSAKDSQLEAAVQLAGTGMGDLSLIAALHGRDAVVLNDAVPRLMLKLEESGHFTSVRENFEIHRGVVLHSLIPRELPTAITKWIGSDVEMIIGQDTQTIWMGMGHPTPLLDRLLDAIELVDQPATTRAKGPLVRARFQAQMLPELVATDLLIPDSNADVARQAFSGGKDGFSLVIDPISDGLKLRIEFEEGFTKLVGQNWIRQRERPQSD